MPPRNATVSLEVCPFCGVNMFNEEVAKGYTSFAEFLRYIVSVFGIEIYKQKQTLVYLITDLYTGDETMKRVYRRAILDDGISSRLYAISVKHLEERTLFYNRIVSSFVEANFYEQEFGKKVISSFVQGMSLKEEALLEKAQKGDPNAQFKIAKIYDEGFEVEKDYTEAVKWYRKAAEQGNDTAQCNLGVCYQYGQGVSKDLVEAVKWYRKAAEQGCDTAQCNLGVCYEYGQGVSKNLVEAVKWYRKAAEQGYDRAQHRLGRCYEYGLGMSTNYKEAVEWYKKAAEQGFSLAKERLEEIKQKK